MYTLVSAPVLGFDLVRRPGGEHVAALLLRALRLGPDDLAVLAAALPAPGGPGTGREEAWIAVSALEGSRRGTGALVGEVYGAAADHLAGAGSEGAVRARLADLEVAPLGSLGALLRCVRQDVLDWTWTRAGDVAVQDERAVRATTVVCDAVTAAYWYGLLDPGSRRRLAAPWTRAERSLRHAIGVVPGDDTAGGDLVARLRHLDEQDLRRLRAASAGLRATGGWATAVHEAAWAAHLTDRVRPAAAAQLAGVQAVLAGGVTAADSAAGVWNVVSGALAAQVVRDVLADDVVDRLLMPVRLALGLTD